MPRLPKNILAVDLGNTHIHWGIVRPGDLKVIARGNFPTKEPLWAQIPAGRAAYAVYCSVVPKAATGLQRYLKTCRLPFAVLTQKNFPLPIRYRTPETLGHDRLAAALGAVALGFKRAIVVDIGTAITTDAVDAEKGFLGGFISPGMGLMLESLHEHTAQLPLVNICHISPKNPLGQDTASAIAQGCAATFTGGLERLVFLAQKKMGKKATVVATGQGMRFFPKNCAHRCEADLPLRGLAYFGHQYAFTDR